jgi:hypothetical protein
MLARTTRRGLGTWDENGDVMIQQNCAAAGGSFWEVVK